MYLLVYIDSKILSLTVQVYPEDLNGVPLGNYNVGQAYMFSIFIVITMYLRSINTYG